MASCDVESKHRLEGALVRQSTEQSKDIESPATIEASAPASKARAPNVPGTRRPQVMWFLIGSTIAIALFLSVAGRVMKGHRAPEPAILGMDPATHAPAEFTRLPGTRQASEKVQAGAGASASALLSAQEASSARSAPAPSARSAQTSVSDTVLPAPALTDGGAGPALLQPGASGQGSNASLRQAAVGTRATPLGNTEPASDEHPPGTPAVSVQAKREKPNAAAARGRRAVHHTVYARRTLKREVRSTAANKLESIGISEE